MTVLIFGAEGIAGSALMRLLPNAIGTTRREAAEGERNHRLLFGVDIRDYNHIWRALKMAKPSVAVNCAGIVKSECDKFPPGLVLAVNGGGPAMIAAAGSNSGCRLIHLSTDCVYDGTRGGRTELDPIDATDLYGQSKASGEKIGYDALVIRTSFIGSDPTYKRGLLEWLLAQPDANQIAGFTRALWSGISAPELARVIAAVIDNGMRLSGLYHVSGPVITKAALLQALIDAYGTGQTVRQVDEPAIDRTLDDSKFRAATGYVAPSWATMAKELAGLPRARLEAQMAALIADAEGVANTVDKELADDAT